MISRLDLEGLIFFCLSPTGYGGYHDGILGSTLRVCKYIHMLINRIWDWGRARIKPKQPAETAPCQCNSQQQACLHAQRRWIQLPLLRAPHRSGTSVGN